MATVTVVEMEAADGQVRLEWDYEDTTLRMTALRVVNNTSQAAEGSVIRKNDRLIYSQRFPPGTTFINIPTNPQGRIQLVELRPRVFNGYSASLTWPVP